MPSIFTIFVNIKQIKFVYNIETAFNKLNPLIPFVVIVHRCITLYHVALATVDTFPFVASVPRQMKVIGNVSMILVLLKLVVSIVVGGGWISVMLTRSDEVVIGDSRDVMKLTALLEMVRLLEGFLLTITTIFS